jgi:CHAP domain
MIDRHLRAALLWMLVVGLALGTSAAGQPPAGRFPAAPGGCPTQEIRLSLAAQQVSFCAPTSRPVHVVEDNRSDPGVGYAGLDQGVGYGIVNIKASSPGSAPGIGRPVYTSGELAAYRQAVWSMETAKTDRRVSGGPTGIFWNETVPGMQLDLILPTSSGVLRVRSIEWYVEHANRLWSFILTWDTEMQNAGDWQAASRDFTVQESAGSHLDDTAVDLGAAFLESQTPGGNSRMGTPVDVGTPSWWSGTCNDGNFYPAMGVHSYPLGASWHGVPACGPLNSMHLVRFFPGAYGEYEFQCVELVMRFLYQQWGIAPWAGVGKTIKDAPPSSMVFYPNDGTHRLVPGDILTEDGSTPSSSGHAVIITAVNLDGNESGTLTILEQNSSSGGSRSLSVVNGIVAPDAWVWGSPVQGWLHVLSNQVVGDQRQFLPLIISPGK